MSESASPFRPKPWPLEIVRKMLRGLRLMRWKLKPGMRFTHGDEVSLGRGADVRAPRFIALGHHVSVGKNFTCEADLTVGSHVLISSNVSVIGQDHPFEDPQYTVYSAPRSDDSPVTIGSDVLVGYGTIIVGPVTIGDGCIIGAGSVVVKDLPPYTICAGVPARPIRARYPGQAN